MSWATVCAFFNGGEKLNLQTIKRLASELGLRVVVSFEPIEHTDLSGEPKGEKAGRERIEIAAVDSIRDLPASVRR
ncbi:MAG TPA: hypothetical protein VJ302_26885 [Blastocatellia bacterium]|nr:hypothetical protein [Blastocatellia bacterium]